MAVITFAPTPLDPIIVVVEVGTDWALIDASVKVKYTSHVNYVNKYFTNHLFRY